MWHGKRVGKTLVASTVNLKGVEYMCQEMEKIYSEGIEIGEKNGELKKAKETALSLAEMGFPIEKIAKAININVNDVQKWIEKRH